MTISTDLIEFNNKVDELNHLIKECQKLADTLSLSFKIDISPENNGDIEELVYYGKKFRYSDDDGDEYIIERGWYTSTQD